jgi:hypothetical protein
MHVQKEDLKVPIVISIAFSLVIRIYLFYFSDKDQPDFAKKLRLGKLDGQDIAIPNKKYPVKLFNPV